MSDENVLLKASLYDGNITTLLMEAGQICKVFNQQDSGCISYGIEAMGQRWFVKYAKRAEAIAFMQNAERIHRAVAHPRLPKLLNSIHTSEGFALVYEWVDGEVLGTPEFPGKEGRSSPQSPHYRFRRVCLCTRSLLLYRLYMKYTPIWRVRVSLRWIFMTAV